MSGFSVTDSDTLPGDTTPLPARRWRPVLAPRGRNTRFDRPPLAEIHKIGMLIDEWGEAAGLNRHAVYDLLRSGQIKAQQVGAYTVIVTPPTRH